MTEFLKQAFKEAKSLENRALLSHLKRTYMSKRQIGKCEAIYRAIPALNLQGSNISCTFVASGYPENQAKFLRKVKGREDVDIPYSQASSGHVSEYSSDENETQHREDDQKLDSIETENNTFKFKERKESTAQTSKYLFIKHFKTSCLILKMSKYRLTVGPGVSDTEFLSENFGF